MEYIDHLRKDKKLATLINEPLHERIRPHKNIPLQLIGNIMSQQLNTKVADIIYNRFLALYNNKVPTTRQILDTPDERLRAIGLSNAKVKYVKNVAEFCVKNQITDKKLQGMSNDEVIELLTQIDPLLYHADHFVGLTAVLNDVTNIIWAGETTPYEFVDTL